MKKIITLFSLILCLSATAQEAVVSEYMYIYSNGKDIDSIAVSKIDSVTFVVPIIPEEPTPVYFAVDLALPSGTKWATFNVGATKPEEYGSYYAWGETEEKDCYNEENYLYNKNIGSDISGTLYDVAHLKWSDDWRMPTRAEQLELIDECEWKRETFKNVDGYRVIGKNGNSIFLPFTGFRNGDELKAFDEDFFYWSSSLGYDNNDAWAFSYNNLKTAERCVGCAVRPVCGEYVAKVIELRNNNGGIVSFKDNVGKVDISAVEGATLTVVATPNDGYEFAGWFIGDYDSLVSSAAVYSFVVDDDVKLKALFEEKQVSINGYEAVDLGLPSGLKWATFNVGATKPEECGGYYAWGETKTKKACDYTNYKHCDGTFNTNNGANYYTFTKYCTDSNCGVVDNKTLLDPEDDAAHFEWGGDWRMPTAKEFQELMNECFWEWITLNGIDGYKVVGKNGRYIFLPATGYYSSNNIAYKGKMGWYSTKSLYNYSLLPDQYNACLTFDLYDYIGGSQSRFVCCTIRPVCGDVKNVVVESTVGGNVVVENYPNIFDLNIVTGKTITVTATVCDGYKFLGWYISGTDNPVCTDTLYKFSVEKDIELLAKFEKKKVLIGGHEAVDLGLPSGVKWATCNIGASAPEDRGDYYAWGETVKKNNASTTNYKYSNEYFTKMTKYCVDSSDGKVDNKKVLELDDDVAHVKWGGNWRMPTRQEQDELRHECSWLWTIVNGVKGFIVTGKNGNSIFLPTTGYRMLTETYYYDDCGCYWSNMLSVSTTSSAGFVLSFDSEVATYGSFSRFFALPVRPVTE